MEVMYRREMKHNYLIIRPEEPIRESCAVRMMVNNDIGGLLRFRIKQLDSEQFYYYEITSRQPLNRILEQRSITADEIRCLMTGIAKALSNMEFYLLEEGQVWLKPEYIYVEPETFGTYLCLIPGRRGDFPAEMTKLLEYLLGKVDHRQKESVVLAYGLYQISLKDNYGIADLMRLLETESTAKRQKEASGRKEETPVPGWKEAAQVPGRKGGASAPDWKGKAPVPGRKEGAPAPGRKEAAQAPDRKGEVPVPGWKGEAPAPGWKEAAQVTDRKGEVPVPSWKGEVPVPGWKTPVSGYGGEEPGTCQEPNAEKEHAKKTYSEARQDSIELQERAVYRPVKKRRSALWLCGPLAVIPGGFAVVWVLFGEAGIREYGPWLGIGGGAALLISGSVYLLRKRKPPTPKEESGRGEDREPDRWQMIFEEEPEEAALPQAESKPVQESGDTVLLADFEEDSASRYLQSVDPSIPGIPIPYVPFVIGKQEGLADYILAKDTVSRLHVRIDREGESYRVTDLNSTNGTWVRGKLLEANESAALNLGDKICIANLEFIFT